MKKEPMTARHPLWFKISAYGFVLYLMTLLLMFLLSVLVYGLFPQLPTESTEAYTVSLAICALPLGFIAFLIAHRFCRPATERNALYLGIGWVAVQLFFNLLIALLNGNFAMIFSSFATYLVYVAVFAGALASRLHRDKAVP
jgi:predicted membrane channel-forming protein YqfA (hemolysin III family)